MNIEAAQAELQDLVGQDWKVTLYNDANNWLTLAGVHKRFPRTFIIKGMELDELRLAMPAIKARRYSEDGRRIISF